MKDAGYYNWKNNAIEPLQSILAAREQRSLLRWQFAMRGLPSVSLSLNVPGYPKSNAVARSFFSTCLVDLHYFLQARQIWPHVQEAIEKTDEAGDFMLLPFSSSLHTVAETKQICEDFEEGHPLGRFIDADVTDREGNPVSSGKAKLCFYCGQKPAVLCRRENAHDQEELRAFMFSRMEAYSRQQRRDEICKKLSSLALRAILYEISLSPKPGLVDKFGNGSHTDMNYQTFIRSSAAIAAYFTDLVHEGFVFTGGDLTRALAVVRTIGMRMESAMFTSTRQVNTQKGIIFLMGLSLFSCGYLFSRNETFTEAQFRQIIRQICHGISRRELGHDGQLTTHGAEIYRKYQMTGARGEAENGFPMVFEFGLPVLQHGQSPDEDAMFRAFLLIAAHNNDTNIVYRSSLNVLEKFKALSLAAFNQFNAENLSRVAEFCKTENISPGGSADLLAVSIFMYFVMNLREENGPDLLKLSHDL